MKTVLVSGASGGLGYAICKRLLEEGYYVVMHYCKNNNNLLTLHEQYKESSFIIQADFMKEEDIYRLKECLDKENICLDILINNAGLDHVSELEEKNYYSFNSVFTVNVYAPFLLMKIFGKDICARKGHILNISSDNTIDKMDVVTMEYDASKAALNMLTKDFSIAYKDAFVNSILFGWLDTPMNDIPKDIKPLLSFVSIEKAVNIVLKWILTDKTGAFEVVSE